MERTYVSEKRMRAFRFRPWVPAWLRRWLATPLTFTEAMGAIYNVPDIQPLHAPWIGERKGYPDPGPWEITDSPLLSHMTEETKRKFFCRTMPDADKTWFPPGTAPQKG